MSRSSSRANSTRRSTSSTRRGRRPSSSSAGGAAGAASTVCEIDLRVGGTWRYVMLAHGEFEVAFHGEYLEIVPDERIVHTEVYELAGTPPLADEDAPVNTEQIAIALAENGA